MRICVDCLFRGYLKVVYNYPSKHANLLSVTFLEEIHIHIGPDT